MSCAKTLAFPRSTSAAEPRMADEATERLLREHEKRIRDAVALGRPDRVPVVPNGAAWAARVTGTRMLDFCTDPRVAYPALLKAYTSLGEIDGFQAPSYHVNAVSLLWLSRVKVPGRDLPENEMWQIDETGLMSVDDYDAILAEGYGPWLDRYFAERLPGVPEEFACLAESEDEATAAWNDKGVVIFSPGVFTIPYENFCGGRSMKEFLLDLFRRPDKVQAAMDMAAPVLLRRMREVVRARRPMAVWVGGWRSASEFLAPRLWERFVFPYLKRLVEAVVEEGVIAVLHFDANWTRDLERLKELPKARCVLSLDGKTDIFKAKEVLADHMCIMGDVHPSLLSLGTPKQVTEYCRRLIREVGPSGFILSSGCDVPPEAPIENVRAMVESVRGG
jgi:hypothetical protein